jgi:hypothetical protein
MSQHLREVARGGATGIVRTTVPVKKPAAATGFTLTPPAGRAWDVRSLNFTYVSSTSAGTRIPMLALTDGNALLWALALPTFIASLTVTISAVADVVPTTQGTAGTSPLVVAIPETILLPGWSLGVGLAGVTTADQLSGITAQVDEVFTGNVEWDRTIERNIVDHADALAAVLTGGVLT